MKKITLQLEVACNNLTPKQVERIKRSLTSSLATKKEVAWDILAMDNVIIIGIRDEKTKK